MAKKEKIKKVNAEELKLIQEQQKNYQQIVEQLGLADVRKHLLFTHYDELSKKIEESKKVLEEKYGNVNINISDGSYEDIKKDDDSDLSVVKSEE